MIRRSCESIVCSMMLYAITHEEDKRMRFQRLYKVFVLVLVLAALSASLAWGSGYPSMGAGSQMVLGALASALTSRSG